MISLIQKTSSSVSIFHIDVFQVILIKLVRHWSRISGGAPHKTYAKSFCRRRVERENEKNKKGSCKAFCVMGKRISTLFTLCFQFVTHFL